MKHTIVITEDMADAIKDAMAMTHFKFNSNIKRFLADLLEDPVNSEPNVIFKHNGIDRNTLLKGLENRKVIVKKMNIDDHDSDGKPHKAMMIVKYSVPKERFQEKLDALFDDLFPNFPTKIEEEGGAGGGAASCSGVDGNGFGSGEFIQPLFGVQKKKKYSQAINEGVTGVDDEHRGAAGYIYCQDADGQWCILAGKRITNDDSNSLMNPPMGHLHVDEDPHDGVARECREETDIDIPKNRFIQKDVEEYAKGHFTYHFVAILYGDTTEQHEPGEGDGENEHFKWIPVSEIGNYKWAFGTQKKAVAYIPSATNQQNPELQNDPTQQLQQAVAESVNEDGGGATSTCGGGLPGEFDVPFGGDKETLDRTPGNTCGMHNRVGNSNLIKKKVNNRRDSLNESQESKSIDAAKRLFMQRTGKSAEEADKFVRIDLRNDIPALRDKNGGKFILGVTRMYLDRQLTNASTILNLNRTLKLLTQGHFNEYDRNLNGMSAQDVISRFSTAMKQMDNQEREELGSMVFNENSDYQIVRIDDFEQSSQYGKYTSWCVTKYENMFNSYTSDGIGQFYFCLRNGFENEPEQVGEGCPLDSYGLSMVAVSVDENGRLNTCTCRWNHDNGGNDNIMDTKQISHLIGRNFFDAFKPNGRWQEIVGNAMTRLRNGESPEDVFDWCEYFINGLAKVELNGKQNWLRADNGQLLSDQWFDSCDDFSEGFSVVKLNGKFNWVRADNGHLLSDQWYDYGSSFSEGFFVVKLNGKWNWICVDNGQPFSDQWFDLCDVFREGLARVKLNDKFNWMRADNGQFFSDQWFDYCGIFREGLAVVKLNGKQNWLRVDNGQFFSDKWFEECRDFSEGFSLVKVNGKYIKIRRDGVLCDYKGQPIQEQSGLSEMANRIVDKILNESQESKSIDAAKRLFMQRTGKSAEEADKFVRIDLRNDMPVLRDKNGGKFILGVTRMFLDRQLADASTILNLNRTLKLLTQGHFNEYDRNLNGMSAQDVISRFSTAMKQMDDSEREELAGMKFTVNNDYQIVRIDDFEQSSQYGQYTSWCVTHDEDMLDSYTSDGIGQFYFCLRDGFENEPKQPGENCPLDSYGLSMVAVSVDENGRLNTCTCRWNHDNGGNDNIMDTKQISQLIGRNFFDVFKPNGMWRGIVDDAMNRLRNGEFPEDVFNSCGDFYEGLTWVELNGKYNWLRADNGQLLSGQWYDNSGDFYEGLARVEINGKWNWVRADNGQLFDNRWYNDCGDFHEGLAWVELNGKYNWVRADNGQLFGDRWYNDCGDFYEGLAWAELNGKYNWVRADNGQLFGNRWYDGCSDFSEGMAAIKLNNKYNWVRADNGQLFSDQWFDACGNFYEGLARVEINGKWNWVRADNGQLFGDRWYDGCSDFSEGMAAVELNDTYYKIRRDGVLCDYDTKQPISQE